MSIRLRIAGQLLKIAKELIAIQFDTEQQLQEYKRTHEVRPTTKLTIKKKDPKNSQQSQKKTERQPKQEQQTDKKSTSAPAPKKFKGIRQERKIKTKDEQVQKMIQCAQGMLQDSFFDKLFDKDGNFTKKMAKKWVDIDLSIMDPSAQKGGCNVGVIIVNVDKMKEGDWPDNSSILDSEMQAGTGQMLFSRKGNPYVVVYCGGKGGDFTLSNRYVAQTVTHQTMHFLDSMYDSEIYEENTDYPYPGGGDGGQFDAYEGFQSKYGPYYTSKVQRKQYTYDLMTSIDKLNEQQGTDKRELIQSLINDLDDKKEFMKLVRCLEKCGFNISCLPMLYHLAFGGDKKGKEEAKKILQNFLV